MEYTAKMTDALRLNKDLPTPGADECVDQWTKVRRLAAKHDRVEIYEQAGGEIGVRALDEA